MKKLVFLIALSGLLVGCTSSEDMSSPPADTGTSTNTTNNASTNQ